MNQLVLSGTATLVRSGTGSSRYWGPKSGLRPCGATLCSARNFPNLKSFGFSLTDPAFDAARDNRQKLKASTVPVSLHNPIQSQRICQTWLRQQARSAHGRIATALLSLKHPHRLPGITHAIGVCDPWSMADRLRRRRPATGFFFSNMEDVHERSHAGRDSVA